MKLLVAAAALTLSAFVLRGIGARARRLAGTPGGTWPVSIGLGLSVLVFAGGLLNLARLAAAPGLWALIAAAIAVSALESRREAPFRLPADAQGRAEIAAAAAVIAAALVFAIHTQLPPTIFNVEDDFKKYFAHPVRMLATGTLAGSPLNSLGLATLGGQAFLHGLVLSLLPIGYINGVDAVFGFLVLMLIGACAGWRRFRPFPGAMLGPLLIAAVNPQYVNVTTLYLGGALMATAVMLVADDREDVAPAPVLLGAVYAALVALKPSFALFMACHLPLCVLAARGKGDSWKSSLAWGARAAAWTVVALAPWLALYAPEYLARGDLARAAVPGGFNGETNLFSTDALFYGASFAHYTAIACLAGWVAVSGVVSWRRELGRAERRVALGVAAGAATGILAYVLLVLCLRAALGGTQSNLRYAIPFMLGTSVISILLAPSLSRRLPRAVSTAVPLLVVAAIAAAFVPSARARGAQALKFGSILAFSQTAQSPVYRPYNEFWLSPEAKRYVRGFQDKVPPGEPLLAWINAPFLLDFARNKVVDVDTAGIAAPWARIPRDVRYFLVQYRGLGVKTPESYALDLRAPDALARTTAAQAIAFSQTLTRLSAGAEVVARDPQFVLFRLAGAPEPPRFEPAGGPRAAQNNPKPIP